MREIRFVMGMPFTLTLADEHATLESVEKLFTYLTAVDERFSTYKDTSEVSRVNRGECSEAQYSSDLRDVLATAEHAKKETDGYFNVCRPDGRLDPSGVVKGWALQKATELLEADGVTNFMLDGAGDIASAGVSPDGTPWSVGIRNPFNHEEVVKVLYPKGRGVATSGTAIRGAHIYNPLAPDTALTDIVSVTVVAPDVLMADLFATATFAMGKQGITLLEQHPDLEGYAIDKHGTATMTSGFPAYTTP